MAAILLSTATTVYATAPGFYLGAMVGPSNIHAKTMDIEINDIPPIFETVKPTSTGFGERAFAGYQLNPYAGFEMGFTHYGSAEYKVQSFCNNPLLRENAIDVVGKLMFPFSTSGFDVFGKGGFAVVRSSQSSSLTSSTLSDCGGNNANTTSVRPTASLGASYDITQAWVADLSYNHIFGGSGIQNVDFVALGISYHFVDLYCGQFLC